MRDEWPLERIKKWCRTEMRAVADSDMYQRADAIMRAIQDLERLEPGALDRARARIAYLEGENRTLRQLAGLSTDK